jgi:hypothetical protein
MIDLPHSIQEIRHRIYKFNLATMWCLYSTLNYNWEVPEERINTSSPSLMIFNIISHFICCKPFISIVLLSNIIWILRLVEVGLPILAIPLKHMAESVLDSEAISCHMVSVDLQTCDHRVLRVDHLASLVVVCSPEPSVIDDHVSRVDFDHVSG